MAQLPCIGLYKLCINLPFGDCAMYFDNGVTPSTTETGNGRSSRNPPPPISIDLGHVHQLRLCQMFGAFVTGVWPITDPGDERYIYLYTFTILSLSQMVGKYTSPICMDPMDFCGFRWFCWVIFTSLLVVESWKPSGFSPKKIFQFWGGLEFHLGQLGILHQHKMMLILLMDEILHHLGWLKPYR